MTRYVVGMYRKQRIHVGEVEDFKQHIGLGQDRKYHPELVVDLARTWKLYDERGYRLDVSPIAGDPNGDVEFVARGDDEKVSGPVLVAEINYIMGIAQSRLAADRAKALAATVGTARGIVEGNGSSTDAKKLATAIGELRALERVAPFPTIDASLPVVLAALAELFHYNPTAAPNFLNPDHDWAHRHNMTHR